MGADVKDEKVAVGGWIETTDLDLMPFIKKYTDKIINKVICTDISKDGMLQGPAIDLYQRILAQFPDLYLIASGGVSCLQDVERLQDAAVPAVIVGKAFYENRIKLSDLKAFV